MPSPSKTKGKSFEREVATFLTETYGETFMRVQNSGAFVGGANAFRKQSMHAFQIMNMKGDIVPGPSFPHLNIECKSYKSFQFHKLIQNTEIKILNEWITQLLGAADTGDLSLLIMKFNNIGRFVAFQTSSSLIMAPTLHGIHYNHPTHGTFYFTSFEGFWQTNKDLVKQISA